MKVCVWQNTTKSGIGDRLQDILLVLSYSRYHNCDKLLMKWITIKQCGNSGHVKERPKFRELDQKIDIMKKYIKFPDDLIITNNPSSVKYKSKIDFSNYLGGVYSKNTFISKHGLNKEKYSKIYDQVIDDFGFISNNYFDIIDKTDKLLAVHLRRTDKVMDNINQANAALGITKNQLKNLNENTIIIINKYIEKGYKNITFISDSIVEKNNYITLYKDKCTIIDINGNLESGEQTYIDLYSLIKADIIIMSQQWSNFSVISSILGKNKLVYFDKEYINKYKYNDSNNYIFYKDV